MFHWILHHLPQIGLAYLGIIVVVCVFMTMAKQASEGIARMYSHEGVIFRSRIS